MTSEHGFDLHSGGLGANAGGLGRNARGVSCALSWGTSGTVLFETAG